MDVWNLALKRGFGVPSLDYALLGRWVLHMRRGVFRHERIGDSPALPTEHVVGWVSHYSIGVVLATAFLSGAPAGWLDRPTIAPPVLFGLATVVLPLFVLQPALGLGLASSRAPSPGKARLKSCGTHLVFGVGLYLCAVGLARLTTLAA